MLEAHRIVRLTLGMLLSVASIAEEENPVKTDHKWMLDTTFYLDDQPEVSDYSALLETRFSIELTPSTDDWPENIAELDFQDASIFGRVRELRNLSLLTLAEFGQKRIFFGVNESGMVGVHFGSFSGGTDRRYLEIVRLPYLDEIETGDNDSESEPESDPQQPLRQ